jgi:hypothetical protein
VTAGTTPSDRGSTWPVHQSYGDETNLLSRALYEMKECDATPTHSSNGSGGEMQTPNFFQIHRKAGSGAWHMVKLRCPSRAATSRRRATWSFRHACQLGLEGIVSKRLGSRYTSGRSRDWLKFKNPAAPAVSREAEEDWG